MLLLTADHQSARVAEQPPGTKPRKTAQQKEQDKTCLEERLIRIGKERDDLSPRPRSCRKALKKMNRHVVGAEMKRKLASRKLEEMRTK